MSTLSWTRHVWLFVTPVTGDKNGIFRDGKKKFLLFTNHVILWSTLLSPICVFFGKNLHYSLPFLIVTRPLNKISINGLFLDKPFQLTKLPFSSLPVT